MYSKKIDPSIKLLTEKEEIFINNHINGISLKWKDGESNLNRDIQFFPQSYMYEIATSVAKTNEIIETIIKENDTDKNLSKYDSFNSSNRTEIINKLNNLFNSN